jgi:hypothetical protein
MSLPFGAPHRPHRLALYFMDGGNFFAASCPRLFSGLAPCQPHWSTTAARERSVAPFLWRSLVSSAATCATGATAGCRSSKNAATDSLVIISLAVPAPLGLLIPPVHHHDTEWQPTSLTAVVHRQVILHCSGLSFSGYIVICR